MVKLTEMKVCLIFADQKPIEPLILQQPSMVWLNKISQVVRTSSWCISQKSSDLCSIRICVTVKCKYIGTFTGAGMMYTIVSNPYGSAVIRPCHCAETVTAKI